MATTVEEPSLDFWEIAAVERPYDSICAGWSKERFDTDRVTLADKLELNDKMVFLDLCCGIGRIAKWVAPQVCMYWGVDFSTGMIIKAREYNEKIKNAIFNINDGCTLPFIPDSSVDACVCEIAFQHMLKENIKAYVKEVLRVLKPGGQFISHVPTKRYVGGFSSEELPVLLKGFDYHILLGEGRNGSYFVPLAKKKKEVTK